jgi:hypothetical protein
MRILLLFLSLWWVPAIFAQDDFGTDMEDDAMSASYEDAVFGSGAGDDSAALSDSELGGVVTELGRMTESDEDMQKLIQQSGAMILSVGPKLMGIGTLARMLGIGRA